MTDAHVTDLAADLLDLCRLLQNNGDGAVAQCTALSRVYGIAVNSAEFHTLTAAVRRRFDELHRIVQTDPVLRSSIKITSSKAIAAIAAFLNIENAVQNWGGVVQSHFKPEDLRTLEFLSELIQPRYPLKRLDDEERRRVAGEVQEFLDDLRADRANLGPFVAEVLIEAFENLLLTLEKFPFFGHAALTERIALARVMISAAEAHVRRHAAPGTSPLSTIRKAWNILATVTTLIVMPHGVTEAIGAYRGWTQSLIEHVAQSVPPEIKALPAPKPKPRQIEDKSQVSADQPGDEQP